jgi:dTDP-4-dehydrorhamnose reductase
MKILIVGGNGFLGSHFSKFLSEYREAGIEIAITAEKFERENDLAKIDFNKFHAVVYCSGIVNIEECEKNPTMAFWVNSEIPSLIARKLARTKTKFVYISTDAVFDGAIKFATENDSTNPLSIYGESKLRGENETLNSNDGNLVCRVNFIGRSPKNNSLFDYFLEKLNAEQPAPGYKNVFFTPLYVDDVIHGLIKLINFDSNGIFHLVGNDRMSKFEFGQIVEKFLGKETNLVTPVEFTNLPSSPKRSLDLSLSNEKARHVGIVFPPITSRLGGGDESLKNRK